MTESAEVSGHMMPPRSSLTLITCVLPWSAGARPVPRILPLAASLQLAWPHGLRFRYASSGNHAVACHTFPRPAMTCRVACSAFVSTLRTGGGGRGTVPLAPRGAHLWAPRPTRDAAAARPAPEGSCWVVWPCRGCGVSEGPPLQGLCHREACSMVRDLSLFICEMEGLPERAPRCPLGTRWHL